MFVSFQYYCFGYSFEATAPLILAFGNFKNYCDRKKNMPFYTHFCLCFFKYKYYLTCRVKYCKILMKY